LKANLATLVLEAPLGLVLVGGLVYLLTVRRRSRRAARFASVGLLVMIALQVFGKTVGAATYQYVVVNISGGLDTGLVVNAYWGLLGLLHAVGPALLIMAVMADRRGPASVDD
jgi:hypothetical protein